MKKVLILAYDFPPYVSVGGLRPYSWYKYLSEFGVEPIVVTRQWSNQYGNYLDYIAPGTSKNVIEEISDTGKIYRTPFSPNLSNKLLIQHGESKFKLIRKFISGYYEFAQFLWPIGPKAELYWFAKNYLKNNKVDAIIATGDPFVLFSFASRLSKQFEIPWIADYRDTWVQDKTRSSNKIRKKWNAFFERKYLNNSSKITTVSSFIIKQIEQNLPEKNYEILLNGFNPDVMEAAKDIKQNSDVFTISFAGTIYKWHPIKSFLKICNRLVTNGKLSNFRIQFYGINIPNELEKLIQLSYPELMDLVTIYPKIENEELVKKLAKANLFLLFNDYSILGTKIFTYIGLRRRIILCFSDDDLANNLKDKYYNLNEFDSESKQLQENLINETKAGIIIKNESHLEETLIQLKKEFDEFGTISCNSTGTEKYSRKYQAEKLAKLIKELDY
jgi:hypothetical protein